jgi:hypothetical protein
MAEIKVRLPEVIRLGEPAEVKTLALAPPLPRGDAEFDAEGVPIPHYVGFEAEFDGRAVLRAALGPGLARDMMFTFAFRPDRPGTLLLRWRLRTGGIEERRLAVVPRG